MFGWLCTARPEVCASCGGTALLLARTCRCAGCEARAYDAEMTRLFPMWWRPDTHPMPRRAVEAVTA